MNEEKMSRSEARKLRDEITEIRDLGKLHNMSDEADFHYKCTDYYDPSDEGSILWNDRDLNISWPIRSPVLSKKDALAKRLSDLIL